MDPGSFKEYILAELSDDDDAAYFPNHEVNSTPRGKS